MSVNEERLTITKTIPIVFEAYRKTEPVVGEDGKKSYTLQVTISTDAGMALYRQFIIDAIEKGDYKKLDECLEEWMKFRLAQACGIKKQPVEINEKGEVVE